MIFVGLWEFSCNDDELESFGGKKGVESPLYGWPGANHLFPPKGSSMIKPRDGPFGSQENIFFPASLGLWSVELFVWFGYFGWKVDMK